MNNGTHIEKVFVQKLDLDFECMYDLMTGHGIRISNPEAYNAKKEKNYDGLQSEFWGTDFGDDNAFQERYSCKCKKYIGKMHAGMTCEQCGTKVEYTEVDVTKTGWIILDHNRKVISPIYAMKLSDALGKIDGNFVLSRILEIEFESDNSTQREYTDKEILEMKLHPFVHKGMTWLYHNFDEVIDYYEKKKPNKSDVFQELREDKDKVFTSCIPVFSSILRIELPGVKDEKLFKMRSNTYYQSIIQTFNKVNRYDEEDEANIKNAKEIDRQLASAHQDISDLFLEIFKILDGKKGVIQSKVIGGRYNWCSRNIITPSSGQLRANEVLLSYISFMELYRYELTNYYSKITGCRIAEADAAWKQAKIHFSETFYGIIEHMLKYDSAYLNVIINRNPSINYGSFLVVKVAGVKRNIHDKTLTIPTPILSTMGADFDGDQLNVFRIIGLDMDKRFSKNLDPRYNLYISRMDGRVNPAMFPIKDEASAFWAFNNI